MYEKYYDKLQPHFIQENLQCQYIDTDAFALSVNTKNIIEDLKNLEDIFDFSNLDENQELFRNEKKVVGRFKIETLKNIWIDEFICLRSKACSFKCEDDHESKIKLKGTSKSQSKHIKIENYKKCLDGEKYQEECEIYFLRSINHEMYLQKIKKIFIISFR